MAGRAATVEEGVRVLRDTLSSGKGLEKFHDFVVNQSGDPAFIDDPRLLPQAPVRQDLLAESEGYLAAIDAEAIGRASVELGGGRLVKGAAIDYSVGFIVHKKTGDK